MITLSYFDLYLIGLLFYAIIAVRYAFVLGAYEPTFLALAKAGKEKPKNGLLSLISYLTYPVSIFVSMFRNVPKVFQNMDNYPNAFKD